MADTLRLKTFSQQPWLSLSNLVRKLLYLSKDFNAHLDGLDYNVNKRLAVALA